MNDTEQPGSRARAAHLRDLPVFLRAPRAAGLWLVGVLIPLATVAALTLSYRGLFDWARYHGWPWYLAPLFPLLIDVLIVAGEVVLFNAAVEGKTPRRVRAAAWVIVLVFTALSVIGNVGHAATSDVLTRGGWGLPPVVLAIALGFGLGELKRQAAKYRAEPPPVPVRVPLPAFAAIRGRRKCSQKTAGIVRAEVQLDRRNRGAPGSTMSPVAAPAGKSPPVPAGASALNGSHG